MSRFGTYLGSGFTISVQKTKTKKKIYSQFLFIYCEQTLVQITIFHLDVNILNNITLFYIYIYIYIYIICSTYIYTHTRNHFLKYTWFTFQITGEGGAVRHVTVYIWRVSNNFCETLNLFTERKLKWQKAASSLFSLWFYINKSRPLYSDALLIRQ